MNWIDIAGGIGKGVSQGTADLREMRNEKLRNEMLQQQMRLQQEQLAEIERQKAIRTDLRGIRRPGQESFQESYKEAGAGADQARALEAQTGEFGQEGADLTRAALGAKGPAKGKKSTRVDMLKDTADVYAKHGEAERADAASVQARSAEQMELRDQVTAKYRSFIPMVQQDPAGFLSQYAPEWYKQMVPDGHSAAVQTTPSGLKISIYDDKTGKMIHGRDIPAQALGMAAKDVMDKMYLYEIGQISPEDFRSSFELGLKQEDIGTRRMVAQTQASHAAAQDRLIHEQIRTGNFGAMGENQARAAYYGRGSPGQTSHAAHWTPFQDAEGNVYQHDSSSGSYKDAAGNVITDPKRLQKIGAPPRPKPEVDPEEKKTAYRELESAGFDQKMIAKVKAKYPRVFANEPPDPRIADLQKAYGVGKAPAGEEKTPGPTVVKAKRLNPDDAEKQLRGKHRTARSREEDQKIKQLDELEKGRKKGLYRTNRVQEEQEYQQQRRRILFGDE